MSLPDGIAADGFTDDGVAELGLPVTYPLGPDGDLVPHATCQPIGQRVFDEGLDGVDCRSAAEGGGRELAWYPRGTIAGETARRSFAEWW